MNLFNRFFTAPIRCTLPTPAPTPTVAPPRPTPAPRPTTRPATAKGDAADDVALSVSKVVRQLAFIDRSYALGLYPAGWTNLQDDLTLMHRHGDLKEVCLELVGVDKVVLFEFRVTFAGDDRRAAVDRVADVGRGVELPLLGRDPIAATRLLVHRRGADHAYRERLKLRWSTAVTLPKAAGSSFASDHAAAITGGRHAAAFHVARGAEHRLQVTQVGNRGYAFARDLTLGVDGVYCHARFAPPGHPFRVGEHLAAVVVQTPRGLQARTIRPA